MTTVRIYQPSQTAMQSGKGKTENWLIEFETLDPLLPNPLMGWVESHDMSQELHLSFSSLTEAVDFAVRKGFEYTVQSPCKTSVPPKNYAFNFTCPRVRGGVLNK